MKGLLFIPILLLLCGVAESAPSISNYSNGVITCTDAGTHTDNNVASQDYLCVGYDTFNGIGLEDVFDTTSSESLTTTGVRENDPQCVYRSNADSGGGASLLSSSTNDGYYTDFWYKEIVGTTWPANGQNKLIRIGNASFGYPNITFGKHQFTADEKFIATNETSSSTTSYNQYASADYNTIFEDGEWHHIRAWFKPSTGIGNTDGQLLLTIDGNTIFSRTDIETDTGALNTFNGKWNILGYRLGPSEGAFFDDVYFDYSRSQVYIGDNATFSSCTHLEIQPPTAWSDTSITIEQNKGSFNDGDTAYLFVVDSDGTVSDGYEIVVGLAPPVLPGINGAVTIKGAVTITP